MLRVAVLGLGEAGSVFATGLADLATVSGFDPVWDGRVVPFAATASAAQAVDGADVVLALTSAADAQSALDSALGHAPAGALYADLSTSSPGRKRELADIAAVGGLTFVEGVLMAPVMGSLVATPVLAAGPGANSFAVAVVPLGMDVTVLGQHVGEAAARKLLRSIVVKGLTALMVESLRAAEELGLEQWCAQHLTETLSGLDPAMIARLLDGTTRHSARRTAEMQAAVEMITSLGEPADMTKGTAQILASVDARGMPRYVP